VPPLGATSGRANIEDVPRATPRDSVVVYKGKRSIAAGAAPNSRADIHTRLTPAGRKLAKRLGARKLAARLASGGRIWLISRQPRSMNPLQRLPVPMGNCFADDQLDPGYPCKQTCPPFPHMPTGYVIYATLGQTYGSPTCTKGAPLIPWPAY
jgi:hypothetical protein